MSDQKGRGRHLQISVASFHGHTPDRGLRVLAVHDVTERIRMEQRLKEQERLAALGTMAAGVAHEVNTPLTGISSYAQMLLADTPEDDRRHAVLKKVERQTFRAARIVNNLLEFARSKEKTTGPVDMVAVTEEVIDLLAERLEGKQVEVRWIGRSSIAAKANEAEIHQIVTNLVINAIDAMSEQSDGGDDHKKELLFDIHSENGSVTLDVLDSGPGIPEDHLDQIFQPFFSTKTDRGGTGLGLSISHELARRYDGQLLVHNREDRGCMFSLILPRDSNQARLPNTDETAPQEPPTEAPAS